jgi:omega-6 fatty acid desaturase (delta-12 desaturase)
MNKYTKEQIDRCKEICNEYIAKDDNLAWMYLFSTLSFLSISSYFSLFSVFFVPVMSLFILRLFIIFHDLCHKSFFTDKRLCLDVSRWLEVLVIEQSTNWVKGHSHHHRVHGNLDVFDIGKTVMPISEFKKKSSIFKILYRVLRFPPVFFLLIPFYIFWISKIKRDYIGYFTKYFSFMYLLNCVDPLLMKHFFCAQYGATIIGTALFHLQHSVNPGYWEHFDTSDNLSYLNAQILGSSVLKIPPILDYFTFGIEYHCVHHIDTRVPGYNTAKVYSLWEKEGLVIQPKVSYFQSIKTLTFTFYDEETKQYY